MVAGGDGHINGTVEVVLAAENRHYGITHKLINVSVLCYYLFYYRLEQLVYQFYYFIRRRVFRKCSKPAYINKHHGSVHHFVFKQAFFKPFAAHKVDYILIHVHLKDII